jgi:hypothetical protein
LILVVHEKVEHIMGRILRIKQSSSPGSFPFHIRIMLDTLARFSSSSSSSSWAIAIILKSVLNEILLGNFLTIWDFAKVIHPRLKKMKQKKLFHSLI